MKAPSEDGLLGRSGRFAFVELGDSMESVIDEKGNVRRHKKGDMRISCKVNSWTICPSAG